MVVLFVLLCINFVNTVNNKYGIVIHLSINALLGSIYLMFLHYIEVMHQDERDILIEKDIIDKERMLFKYIGSRIGITDTSEDKD